MGERANENKGKILFLYKVKNRKELHWFRYFRECKYKIAINELCKVLGQNFKSMIINKEKGGYNFVFKLNSELVPHDRDDKILKEGDILSIFSPISGG